MTVPLVYAMHATRVLGQAVAAELGQELAPHEERDFEGGEHKARPLSNVRGRDTVVVQSLSGDARASANDKLCRLLFFVGALKEASAASVTVIAPYLCYSRKDRQTKARDPVTTRYVAQLLETMGTDALLTVDVHNLAAFQNAFRCRTDHVDARLLFAEHFASVVGDDPATVVTPDLGGAKRAERFRAELERRIDRPVGFAFVEKQRSRGEVSGREDVFGPVAGSTAIIYDDMISGGTTMLRAARACRTRGAGAVYAAATHGAFTPASATVLKADEIDGVVITDSIDPADRPINAGAELTVLPLGPLLAEVVRRIASGGSVADLLRTEP